MRHELMTGGEWRQGRLWCEMAAAGDVRRRGQMRNGLMALWDQLRRRWLQYLLAGAWGERRQRRLVFPSKRAFQTGKTVP